MSDMAIVPLDRTRAALTGVTLPDPPPTRIYASGRLYRLAVSPSVSLPPIVNVIKIILNWVGAAGVIAKNIGFLKVPSSFVTSDPVNLTTIANDVMTSLAAGSLKSQWSSVWQLQGVTAKDLGGTTAQSNSTVAPINGTSAGGALPPSVALCVSWQIAESYRGGKPRWYLPALPNSSVTPAGSATIDPAYATAVEAQWTAFMTSINSAGLAGGGSPTLGTVSYRTGHAVRPTPLFRTFINVKIHERADSQRRRSGPERLFGVIP